MVQIRLARRSRSVPVGSVSRVSRPTVSLIQATWFRISWVMVVFHGLRRQRQGCALQCAAQALGDHQGEVVHGHGVLGDELQAMRRRERLKPALVAYPHRRILVAQPGIETGVARAGVPTCWICRPRTGTRFWPTARAFRMLCAPWAIPGSTSPGSEIWCPSSISMSLGVAPAMPVGRDRCGDIWRSGATGPSRRSRRCAWRFWASEPPDLTLYARMMRPATPAPAGDGHHADQSRVADQTPNASERHPLNRRGFTCACIPDSRL
jgi:hypothetical protein